MQSQSLILKLNEYRAKARQGTLTIDELRDAIKDLREGRAIAVTKQKTTRAAKAKPSGDDLLSELDGL